MVGVQASRRSASRTSWRPPGGGRKFRRPRCSGGSSCRARPRRACRPPIPRAGRVIAIPEVDHVDPGPALADLTSLILPNRYGGSPRTLGTTSRSNSSASPLSGMSSIDRASRRKPLRDDPFPDERITIPRFLYDNLPPLRRIRSRKRFPRTPSCGLFLRSFKRARSPVSESFSGISRGLSDRY